MPGRNSGEKSSPIKAIITDRTILKKTYSLKCVTITGLLFSNLTNLHLFTYIFCYLIGDLLGQADGYIAQHAF